MEEKKLNEQESLELITAMISRTQERYIGDGNILLVWGYLVVVITLLVWGLLYATQNPAWNWLWFLIWIIGGIATSVMQRRKEKKQGSVKTYSDKVTSQIWSVVGFTGIASTFFCLGFQLVKGISCWSMMFPFALIIVPFAEIAQGIVLKEKSFIGGGAVGLLIGLYFLSCIAGHVTMYAMEFLPLFVLAYIAMMIIPGHMINNKARKDERA